MSDTPLPPPQREEDGSSVDRAAAKALEMARKQAAMLKEQARAAKLRQAQRSALDGQQAKARDTLGDTGALQIATGQGPIITDAEARGVTILTKESFKPSPVADAVLAPVQLDFDLAPRKPVLREGDTGMVLDFDLSQEDIAQARAASIASARAAQAATSPTAAAIPSPAPVLVTAPPAKPEPATPNMAPSARVSAPSAAPADDRLAMLGAKVPESITVAPSRISRLMNPATAAPPPTVPPVPSAIPLSTLAPPQPVQPPVAPPPMALPVAPAATSQARPRAAPTAATKADTAPPAGLPWSKLLLALVLFALAVIALALYFWPVNKAFVELALRSRLGEPVNIAQARLVPFPYPCLEFSGLSTESGIKASRARARLNLSTVSTSLAAWRWDEVELTDLSVPQRSRELWRRALATEQNQLRLRKVSAPGMVVEGLPPALGNVDAVVLLDTKGMVSQIDFSAAAGKAKLSLRPQTDGFALEGFASAWILPLGSPMAWDSVQFKGQLEGGLIDLSELTLSHFGGVAKGRASVQFHETGKPATIQAQLDVRAVDAAKAMEYFYGDAAIAGELSGKFIVTATSPKWTQVLENPQVEGAFTVARATLKNVDLGRFTQMGDPAGQGKFNELTGAIVTTGGIAVLRDLRGVSSVLRANGQLDILADRRIEGTVNTELSGSAQRMTATAKIGGTVAAPTVRRP
jgi:hypothetical protein